MKTIFIIPGFGESAKGKEYKWLSDFFKNKGLVVKLVPIKWSYRVMSDYINEFETFYAGNKGAENYILGFSYGAVIAFATAQKLKPKKIILCSLSPDFAEDMEVMEKWIQKYIGSRRLQDCLGRSGVQIAKELKVPTTILYGEQEVMEYPQMKKRILETREFAKDVTVIEVPGAPHDINFPAYQKAIKKLF